MCCRTKRKQLIQHCYTCNIIDAETNVYNGFVAKFSAENGVFSFDEVATYASHRDANGNLTPECLIDTTKVITATD